MWSKDTVGKRLWDYRKLDGFKYHFSVDNEQRRILMDHLKCFSGVSREYQLRKLQEPYQGIHKKHLLFRVERLPVQVSGAYPQGEGTPMV